MSILHLDFETRSAVDLRKAGVYVYAADSSTDVWCVCYAFDDGPVQTWTPKDPLPGDIAEHVISGGVIFAHNAAFERAIWAYVLTPRYGWPEPAIEQWRCTMVLAYAMGLPGSLEMAGPAAGIEMSKDMAGHRLMRQMAKPRKTKDGKILWWDGPEKIDRLIKYCVVDVEVERALEKRLRQLKPSELDLWHLDQRINDRGVLVDTALADAAKKIVAVAQNKLDTRMALATNYEVTACSNRNQIMAYLKARGVNQESIAKDQLEELLAVDSGISEDVRLVLNLRREAAKASVAKIDALLRGKSPRDGRAKGLLQFHAASTGRWGGRRFQPQNLRRPIEGDIDTLIDAVRTGDFDYVEMMYGEPLSAVADILRGLIIADKGHRIVAADYSAIEGRVLPWLAGEQWKLDAYREFDESVVVGDDGKPIRKGGEKQFTKLDMYCQTASKILSRQVTKKDKQERQAYGKVPELACGYQGGYGAFVTMGANYGVDLPEDQVREIVKGWREAHPNVKQYWYDLEKAAVQAVLDPGQPFDVGRVRFRITGSFLSMRLPNGRYLFYPYPEVRQFEVPWTNKDGSPATKSGLTYMSEIDVSKMAKVVDDARNTSRWARIKTYGGMLAENATQAVARDVMADAMPRLEAAGYPIILTCHDEVVCEVPDGHGSVEEMETIMCDLPAWARGLPIAAEGFSAERYRK